MAEAPSSTVTAVPATPGRWHIIAGVLSIIYGGLSAFLDILFVLSVWLSPWMFSLMGLKDLPPPPQVMWILGSSAISFGLSCVLLLGGLRMVRRIASCLPLIRFWVVARLLMTVIGLVVGYVTMHHQIEYQRVIDSKVRDMMEAQQAGSSSKIPPFVAKDREAQARAFMAGFAVIGVAFPIFLGLLSTNRRKCEEIESWRNEIR